MAPRKPHVVVPLEEYTSLDQTVDLVSDLLSGRIIAFHRQFVDLAGSAAGALFLSQAMYWTSKGEDGWFYKSRDEWTEETGLTRYEQEAARKALRSLGILEEVRKGCPFQLHFRINKRQIYSILSHNSSISHSAKYRHHSAENNPMDGGNPSIHSAENSQPYKEAEITTESTHKLHTTTPLLFVSESEQNQNLEVEYVEGVFKYYLVRLGRKPGMYTLTPMRAQKGIQRFRDCMSMTHDANAAVALMKQCVDKLAASDFHREGGYIEWDKQLFGSTEKLQMWLNRETKNGHHAPPEDALARERRKEAERRAKGTEVQR